MVCFFPTSKRELGEGLLWHSIFHLLAWWADREMLRFHVGGKVVEDVDLLRKRHWPWRMDVWPFAILYTIWLVTVVPSIDISDAIIVFGGLVVLHILVWLFTAWSVEFRCFVQYSKVCSMLKSWIKQIFFWVRCILYTGFSYVALMPSTLNFLIHIISYSGF